jgi:mannose-1-phosphate guanylyltransferase
MNKYAVIMAGGVGSRFWPVSRVNRPKQFLDILGMGQSLLQMTYQRFAEILPEENIYIVTNEAYRELIHEQLPSIDEQQILGEPLAKNTAPCIAYACSKIASKDKDAVVVVAPSDHLIINQKSFIEQVSKGLKFASENDALVTLGIKPSRPDTGYGYIQFMPEASEPEVHKVKTFTEKPNEELAQQFMDSGEFLWNAGIFIWSMDSILGAIDEFMPDTSELFKKGEAHYFTPTEQSYIERIYPICQSISIDYGIIEKAENVFVIPSDFGWSDLGTWKSLFEVADKKDGSNVLLGDEIELHNSDNNLVYASKKKVVILEGVKDMFVLDTPDALLICHKDKEQEVKGIVKKLKAKFKGKYI